MSAHDHSGGHAHDHTAGANARQLTIALFLTGTFLIVEVIGGLVFNSLALLSDAAHMFTDAAALGIALMAIKIGQRPADGALEEDRLRERLSLLAPDHASFFRSLSRIKQSDGRLLRRSLRRVVEADGLIDPAELAFVETIETHLRAG